MKWRGAGLAAAVGAAAAFGGCGGQVGGRQFPVTLESDPPQAIAYVVPYDDWLEMEGAALSSREGVEGDPLAKYKVTSKRTPVEVSRPGYSYIYVAEINGKRVPSDRFTPGSVERVSVLVE